MRATACDVCDGEGKVPTQPCHTCQGRGRQVERKTLAVDIPAGIEDGQRIRLSGRGHAGERGGPPGDLYVLVTRRARTSASSATATDLVTALDVPAPLAALGGELEVPTLDGPHEVKIDAGTQPGEVVVLRGQGMPAIRSGRRGDLRVVVNVVIPRQALRAPEGAARGALRAR